MEKKTFFDIITSIPFVAVIFGVLCVVFFVFFVKPTYSYIYHSDVVTQNSSLKISKGQLSFYLSPNLYPEIKRKSSWEKEIPALELKKAALRKELKVHENLKTHPLKPQIVFDSAMWYLVSSGVKTNIDQVKPERAARLLASYYYLKIFNLLVPDYKETQALEQEIIKYINLKSVKNLKFNDYLNHTLLTNKDLPPTEQELKQEYFLSNDDKGLLLCNYYFENIENNENNEIDNRIRKLGFIISAQNCYKNKLSKNIDKKQAEEKLLMINSFLNKFQYK